MTRRLTLTAVALALGLSLGPGAHHAAAQPAFSAVLPREDRIAVGWMIGLGGNNSANSDRVLEMTVFGDVPLRGSRIRASAELARWPFTSVAYGLNGQPGPPFRDTAEVRRLLLQAQRQLPILPGETLQLYYAPGVAWEFWRFDTNRPDRTTGIGVVGVAGLEFLKQGGRVGLLSEVRLAWSLGPIVPGSSPVNLTWLSGVKWRLTGP